MYDRFSWTTFEVKSKSHQILQLCEVSFLCKICGGCLSGIWPTIGRGGEFLKEILGPLQIYSTLFLRLEFFLEVDQSMFGRS